MGGWSVLRLERSLALCNCGIDGDGADGGDSVGRSAAEREGGVGSADGQAFCRRSDDESILSEEDRTKSLATLRSAAAWVAHIALRQHSAGLHDR